MGLLTKSRKNYLDPETARVLLAELDASIEEIARVHTTLGHTRRWLDPRTPQWVRDAVDDALHATEKPGS